MTFLEKKILHLYFFNKGGNLEIWYFIFELKKDIFKKYDKDENYKKSLPDDVIWKFQDRGKDRNHKININIPLASH